MKHYRIRKEADTLDYNYVEYLAKSKLYGKKVVRCKEIGDMEANKKINKYYTCKINKKICSMENCNLSKRKVVGI